MQMALGDDVRLIQSICCIAAQGKEGHSLTFYQFGMQASAVHGCVVWLAMFARDALCYDVLRRVTWLRQCTRFWRCP
jgi:hypothetical protein